MKAIFKPSKLTGNSIKIPPSKSLAHRALICAALCDGTSRIENIDYSVDVLATCSAMETLGANITKGKDYVVVEGISSLKQKEKLTIDCQESGSTLRFLIPICSLCEKPVAFTGKGRLMQRPLSIYERLFEAWNVPLIRKNDSLVVQGKVQSGEIHLRADVSSQFISGLLFALPLLSEDSKLVMEGPFESKSYVDLTVQMMRLFGIEISFNQNEIYIKGNQRYKNTDVKVEADYSQLAFFASLGVLSDSITASGLDADSLQGDRAIVSIIEQMGALIQRKDDKIIFKPNKLKASEIDLADCPDLGPALMMLATFASGTTKIINAGRLRIKESDRIEAMETELRKCGAEIYSTEDTIWIKGKTNWKITEILYGHNDHRIVMALAIGIIASRQEAVIDGAEAISKSYPGFFDDLKQLGVDVHVE